MENIYETNSSTHVEPTILGALKIGDHILINNMPCKIYELSKAKTGKHGSCKVMLIALDIFLGKKYEISKTSSSSIEKVIVERHNYFLTGILDGYLNLMDEKFDSVNHFILPDNELGQKIKKLYDEGKNIKIITLHAANKEMITDCQESD